MAFKIVFGDGLGGVACAILYYLLKFYFSRVSMLSFFIRWWFKTKVMVYKKNIFACLVSVHNTIRLPCHEQICLISMFKYAANSSIYLDKPFPCSC